MADKTDFWVKIPHHLITDPRISDSAIRLWAWLKVLEWHKQPADNLAEAIVRYSTDTEQPR